jgi:hypothetical protein
VDEGVGAVDGPDGVEVVDSERHVSTYLVEVRRSRRGKRTLEGRHIS